MIKYIPFLKLKSNEIMALKELDETLRGSLIPFFDYARREKSETAVSLEAHFIDTTDRLIKSLNKNVKFLEEFYLDNFDLENSFTINGFYNYSYLLSSFADFNVVPVVGIDRTPTHLDTVADLKQQGVITSEAVAFRITVEDFEEYEVVKDDIFNQLGSIFESFEHLDLVLDCRVCANLDSDEIASQILEFINAFTDDYSVRRVIVTGSSLPASIADVTAVATEETIHRVEVDIFEKVASGIEFLCDLLFGDYATVSPHYSDPSVPKYAIRNITAPKIIYTYDNYHFIKRGRALATHGSDQYEGLLKELVVKPFFRTNNSWGDKYLVEKSNGEGADATPGTMVKPLCNSHITYICQQLDGDI